MNRQVGIAVIGCGGIAGGRGDMRQGHLLSISTYQHARLVACVDLDPASAEHAARKYEAAYWTDQVERVLQDKQVDAVLICTRHDSHAELAIRAAGAGKHVMVEKPFGMSVAECRAMIKAAEATGVIMMPAFRCRYCSGVQRARAVIEKPTMIIGQLMDARWADDNWAQHPLMGGGEVLSQGVHMFDLVCYLAGSEPVSLYAVGGTLTHDPAQSRIIDNVCVTLQFASGVIAAIQTGDAGATPFTSKFFVELFQAGTASATIYDRLKQVQFWGIEAAGVAEPHEHMELELHEWVDAIREGRPAAIPARDGLRATLLAHAAFESVRSGSVQRIDLDAALTE